MARTSVATQKIVRTGLAPVMTAPIVDGDVIDAGAVAVQVANASGVSINVTAQSPAQVEALDVAELIVAVPAGATKLIGPFPAHIFGRASGADKGRVYIDYSAVASVTRAVVGF